MDFIKELISNSNIPLLTAFLLGILNAISPCPFATNITAVAYISKDIQSKHKVFLNGILYTIGRIIVYTLIAVILIPIIQKGANIESIKNIIVKYGELILGPSLIIASIFMLFAHKINLPKLGITSDGKNLKKHGFIGSLTLGILFALAFCPTSVVLYFGMLIPLAAAESSTIILPISFAIATGLPVIIVAWFIAYSMSSIGKLYNIIQTLQKYMSKIIALIFAGVGIYYSIINFNYYFC